MGTQIAGIDDKLFGINPPKTIVPPVPKVAPVPEGNEAQLEADRLLARQRASSRLKSTASVPKTPQLNTRRPGLKEVVG